MWTAPTYGEYSEPSQQDPHTPNCFIQCLQSPQSTLFIGLYLLRQKPLYSNINLKLRQVPRQEGLHRGTWLLPTHYLRHCFYFWRVAMLWLLFGLLQPQAGLLNSAYWIICYVIEPKLLKRDIAPKPQYLPTFMQIFCTTLYPHLPLSLPARHNIRIYGSVYFPWKIITAFHKYRGGLMAHMCIWSKIVCKTTLSVWPLGSSLRSRPSLGHYTVDMLARTAAAA